MCINILKLKVKDVKKRNESYLIEKKTSKRKVLSINPNFKNVLNKFIKNKYDRDYVDKPITRAFQILKECGDKFDLRLSPHCLRKTFGYFYYTIYLKYLVIPSSVFLDFIF